jgi:hypothetical protein
VGRPLCGRDEVRAFYAQLQQDVVTAARGRSRSADESISR